MNSKQKQVIIVCLMAVFAMALVPPWKGTGYSIIFDPPFARATIDLIRLCVQALLILLFGGTLYLVFKNDASKVSSEGSPITKDGLPLIVIGAFLSVIAAVFGWHLYNEHVAEARVESIQKEIAQQRQAAAAQEEQEESEAQAHVKALAKLKTWPTLPSEISGVTATLYTLWKDNRLIYRLQLAGPSEELEMAGEASRRYSAILKDGDNLELTRLEVDASAFRPYIDGNGRWAQLATANNWTVCSMDQYEKIGSWAIECSN